LKIKFVTQEQLVWIVLLCFLFKQARSPIQPSKINHLRFCQVVMLQTPTITNLFQFLSARTTPWQVRVVFDRQRLAFSNILFRHFTFRLSFPNFPAQLQLLPLLIMLSPNFVCRFHIILKFLVMTAFPYLKTKTYFKAKPITLNSLTLELLSILLNQ